jgi:AraC-like DNA-binding protein
MPAVAALLERRPAILALRRALPRGEWPLFTARSPSHLATLLHQHCLDAIVIGHDAARGPVLDALRRDYPAIPLILYVPARSDDADLLRRMHRERVAALAIEGIDEPVFPRLLARHGLTARRLADLLPLAARLDLTDDLQRKVWELIIVDAPFRLDTRWIADQFDVRRETLSRRFAAGGAPSLKRAIDAARLVAVAQLLGNPGYNVDDAARLLGFSSVSLLQQTARRTLGVSAREVATLDAGQIASRLSKGVPTRWS